MKPIVKVPVVNGMIAGVLGAILSIVLYYFDRHPFVVPLFFDFRILLFGIFIFFTLKEFRDNYQDGILYFWQGLISCFIFVSVFGATAALILWIFGEISPEFVQSYIAQRMAFLKGFPPDEIERIGKDVFQRNLDQLPATNSFDLAMTYFIQGYAIGFFISIIMSVILRRQPKN